MTAPSAPAAPAPAPVPETPTPVAAAPVTEPVTAPAETPAPADLAPAQNLTAAVDDTVDMRFDPDWTHERIEFHGDDLAVRTPTSQALAGYSLSVSKYVPDEVRNDMTGLFINSHIGPESYGRVMQRLMDPDDIDYTTSTVGELMGRIVRLRTESLAAASEQGGDSTASG